LPFEIRLPVAHPNPPKRFVGSEIPFGAHKSHFQT
jgi:hypothetical protein